MTKDAIDERIEMYCKPHQIEAYQLHISGHSAKEISVIQNLSLESVKRSLIRVNSISQQSNEWWFGLSLRAKNALKKDTDIDSLDKLRDAIASKRLVMVGNSVRFDGLIVPDLGKISFDELNEFSSLVNESRHKKVTVNLTPEQAKFALWVSEKMPHLEHLFDWAEKAFKPEAVEAYLSTASHSEIIMTKFVLGVWRNTNQFDFDLIEAAKTLDARNRSIIVNWLNAPFFP